MNVIDIKNLDDDFYLKFNLEFISKLTENRNMMLMLNTPNSNIHRIKKTGTIRYSHFKIIILNSKIDNEIICKMLKTVKIGSNGLEIPVHFPIEKQYKLAALIGHVMGDGTITPYGNFEYANKDYSLINKTKDYVYDVFNCNIYRELSVQKPTGIIFKIIYPASIGRLLMIAGAPKGKKVTQVFDVPEWIKNGDMKIKSEFVRALFDDDGSVELGNMITFTNSKRKNLRSHHEIYINSICKILEDFEIRAQKRFRDVDRNFKADIRITNLMNLEKFDKLIGFSQVKRNKRLKNLLLNPVRKYDKLGEGKNILYEILKKSDTALTTEELSREFKRTLSNTRNYLSKLEKEGLIERAFPQRHKTETLWKTMNTNCKISIKESLYSIPSLLISGPKTSLMLSRILNKNQTIIRRNLRRLEKDGKIKIIKRDDRGLWWVVV